ncbi:MAG: DUF4185 domain-containing protein [Chthoniobacterales bacterium]
MSAVIERLFGQLLEPTETAGAPEPDGYLYVYGVRNDGIKKLLVARVLPQQIANFDRYQFWTGSAWSNSISAGVPVTDRVSSESSVLTAPGRPLYSRLPTRRPQRQSGGPLCEKPGRSLERLHHDYTTSETSISPNVCTYNAKAHPHLSTQDELLISYNVNTFDFFEHFTNADIYLPRFIWLPLN